MSDHAIPERWRKVYNHLMDDDGEWCAQDFVDAIADITVLEAQVAELRMVLDEKERFINAQEDELTERELQVAAMTQDRNLWKDAHNNECPNAAMIKILEAQVAVLSKAPDLVGDWLDAGKSVHCCRACGCLLDATDATVNAHVAWHARLAVARNTEGLPDGCQGV
jgi:hypothetical protein